MLSGRTQDIRVPYARLGRVILLDTTRTLVDEDPNIAITDPVRTTTKENLGECSQISAAPTASTTLTDNSIAVLEHLLQVSEVNFLELSRVDTIA